MQTSSETTSSKKATGPRTPRKSKTPAPPAAESEFSLTHVTDNLREMVASFDRSPVAFIKENPFRAAFGAFFIGLIFGSVMSKRSVTK